jgi:hypothetical protein
VFASLVRTLVPLIALIIAMCAGIAGLTLGWASDVIARGALAGVLVGLAAAIHVSARTLARRTPEARGAEFRDESIERMTIADAAESAFFDTVSILVIASLAGLFAPATGAYLPPAVALFAALDFSIRALRAWTRLTSVG